MNIYAPKTNKFPCWEFRGRPFKRYGKTWIRAKHKIFYRTWYYSFDDNEIYDRVYEDKPFQW